MAFLCISEVSCLIPQEGDLGQVVVGYTWTPAKYEADDDRYAGTLKVWRGGSPSGLASKPSRSKQTEDRDEAGMRLVSQNFHLDNLDNLEPGQPLESTPTVYTLTHAILAQKHTERILQRS